ncbi:MAG: deoxyribonuclease IV [Planctomycetota bacterium]|nr:deoxyribonuclease IV [Planctomycetota bacterium]
MFGSHLSIAGSMLNALREAESLGLDTVQVFTKNQQQWKAKPLDPAMVRDWAIEVRRLGWHEGGPGDAKGGGGRIVSHASYLANLASPDDVLWTRSIDLMVDEIERCEHLAIPFLVHHPGAWTTSDSASGLRRIAQAYRQLLSRTRGAAVVCCLETTVGAGSQIGGRFDELAALRAAIIDATGEPTRLGFCVDSCHVHAAGYDCSSAAGAASVLQQFDAACGMSNVKCVHLNDSKGACGSHLDRHEHVGAGTLSPRTIKDSGFGPFVNHPHLRGVPKILETPKGTDEKGVAFDAHNLRRLRRLVLAPG